MASNLDPLLTPRSIALVGASADRTKLSGLPLHFLQKHGFSGRLFPVNPRASEVAGLPCYPSLGAIGEPVDLAFLLVGAERVLDVIDECAAAGARAAIVAASGFAEIGGEGVQLQKALVERAREAGIRILGPNCMGVVNVRARTAASFSQSLFVDHLVPGGLAFFSQSGAIGGSALDMAFSRGIGLSHWVSTGNQSDVDVVECALAVVNEPEVDVIALYLEALPSADAYLRLLNEAAMLGKHVIALKSGQSDVGARAALSHTAALVGDAGAFNAVSRQYGALLVNDLEELLDRAGALLTGRVARGARVGIVSSSGGLGVILADELERQGLTAATFTAQTTARLTATVPTYGSANNPVDATATLVARMMSGEAGLWTECFSAVADDPDVDQLIIGLTMITGPAGETLAEEVIAAFARTEKPIQVCWLGADLCRGALHRLREAGIPHFASSARAVRAASSVVDRGMARLTAPTALDEGRHSLLQLDGRPAAVSLSEWECQPALHRFGVRTPWARLIAAASIGDAPDLEVPGPFVVKVQSPDILHKSDIGAVMLPVAREQVRDACAIVLGNARSHRPDAEIEGVMVQQLISEGVEMLVSVTRDPQFGLMLALGLGGTLTEMLGDVAMRRLPIHPDEVQAMLGELRGRAVLFGHRGAKQADVNGLIECVMNVSALAQSIGARLEELEINPLLVLPEGHGVVAADCFVRLSEVQEPRG